MGPHSVAACTPCTFVPGDGVGGSDKYLGNSTPTSAACDWSREYCSAGGARGAFLSNVRVRLFLHYKYHVPQKTAEFGNKESAESAL